MVPVMENRYITQHGRQQSGCMQGLISMFDFRHGHSSQKLLSDKKHGSRRVGGAAHPEAKLDPIDHDYDQADGLSGSPDTDDSNMSMRELMEDEMFQLNQRKQAIRLKEEEQRRNQSANQETEGKRRRWRRSKMSFDLNDIKFTPERPTHRKHKSLSSLDVDNMVAELCGQIHHPDVVDCLNHSQDLAEPPSELQEQSSSPALEDKLQDATEVLVSNFIERKKFAKGEIMQPSRELLNALHLLKLNKDVFMKLLQDPDSQLVKQLHSLQFYHDKNNGNSVDQQDKQSRKYPGFFWRKFRGMERNAPKKGECGQDISKIVVLKPGPRASHDTISRGQAQKVSSHFSLFELTRRLKRTMGKELPDSGTIVEKSMDGVISHGSGNLFIERRPKASRAHKKKDNVGSRSKDIGFTPEQRISNFYSEARKHLAESLADGDDLHVDTFRKQATKPLGRILSYGDYSASPLCSPRIDCDPKLLTSPVISASEELHAGNEAASQQLIEQTDSDLSTSLNQGREHEPSGNAHELADDVASEDSGCVHLIFGSDEHSISSVDISSTMNVQDVEEMITSADLSIERSQPGIPSISINVHDDGMTNESEAKGQSLDLKLDSDSPLASPRFSLKSEDQDDSTDKAEHPSPISVLDPICDEDNMSPPRARLSTASEQLIQPRKIDFEVHTSPSPPCSIMWAEEKDSVFELVNIVMQASGLTWDEQLEKYCLLDCLLEPSLFDELEYIPDIPYYDPQLLFDIIIEALDEICRHDFDGILSKVMPHTASKFRGKDIATITWEGVEWHMQLEGGHHTLDQIIARDYAKSETWVDDLRLDTESIGTGIEEAIMNELIGDAMLSCSGWDSNGFAVSPVEPESGSNMNM